MTSLLKKLLGRLSDKSPRPSRPQTICGTLAPGERIDIGALRAVNDGGYLAIRHLHNDAMLRWLFSGPESEVCINNLGNRADEGVVFDRFSNDTWTFVAKVRPDHLVVFRPVPFDIPLVRTGQGDYVSDWPEAEEGGEIADCGLRIADCPEADAAEQAAELQDALVKAFHAGLRPVDDQAAGLRAAVAGRAAQ